MRQFNTLTGFLLSKSSNLATDDTVTFEGYAAVGDGGAATWQHNGITAQTPSQSPAQLIDGLLNDGNGNQWALVNKVVFLTMCGTDKSDSAVFNAASKAAKNSTLYIPEGVYTGDGLVLYGNTKYIALSVATALISATDGVIFKQPTGSTTGVFQSDAFINDNANLDSGLVVDGFTVTGENGTSGNLMTLSTGKAIIRNCSLLNSRGRGLVFSNVNSSSGLFSGFLGGNTVERNTIRDCQLSGLKFIGSDSSTGDNDVAHNKIGKNNKSATVGEYNLDVERAAGYKITNNVIWQGATGDVRLTALSGGNFTDNQVESKVILSSGVPFVGTEIIAGLWASVISGNQFINSDDGTATASSYTLLSINVAPSQLPEHAMTASVNSFTYINIPSIAIEVLNDPPVEALVISSNAYGNTTVSHPFKYSRGDVENGVFTPTVSFAANGDFVPTYTSQAGEYTRSGDICNFSLRVKFSSNAYASASGKFIISGLPLTPLVGSVFYKGVNLSTANKITYDTGQIQACPYVGSSVDKEVYFRMIRSGLSAIDGSTANFPPSTSDFDLIITGTYQVSNS